MDLNKEDIKALSADTRVAILKSLSKRRKMPAELAKEFSLASSTITEHLKYLENSNLVSRKNTGHKWIYYELTQKGLNVITPKFPINIILGLVGVFVMAAGFLYQFLPKAVYQAVGKMENVQKSAADIASKLTEKGVVTQSPIDIVTIILLVIGAILIGFGFYRKFKKL